MTKPNPNPWQSVRIADPASNAVEYLYGPTDTISHYLEAYPLKEGQTLERFDRPDQDAARDGCVQLGMEDADKYEGSRLVDLSLWS